MNRNEKVRFTVDIPDEVLREVKELTGESDASRAVEAAMRRWLAYKREDEGRTTHA